MNIQIVSNSLAVDGNPNYTNKFSMKVNGIIEAESEDKYIKVMSVSYPKTVRNVPEGKCFFYFQRVFSNFQHGHSNYRSDFGGDLNPRTQVMITSPVYTLPSGHYTTKDIIKFMNDCLNEYSMEVYQMNNGRIRITFSYLYDYILNSTTLTTSDGFSDSFWTDGTRSSLWTYASQELYNDAGFDTIVADYEDRKGFNTVGRTGYWSEHSKGGTRITFYLSEKLNYMLGSLKNSKTIKSEKFGNIHYIMLNSLHDVVEITTTVSGAKKKIKKEISLQDRCLQRTKSPSENVEFKYLPDPTDGINKIFIYCNQVEKSIVGDSRSHLLTVIPLEYYDRENSETRQLETFKPVPTLKKLINQRIDKFEVEIRDNAGDLVLFDSGSVNIEAVIV